MEIWVRHYLEAATCKQESGISMWLVGGRVVTLQDRWRLAAR